MDVASEKPELDTRDCFFTLDDYYRLSCVHYILTCKLLRKPIIPDEEEDEKRTKEVKTPVPNENVLPLVKKARTSVSNENGPSPAKKAKIADGDSQGTMPYEGGFSPPRPVEIGKPLATMSMFDHHLYLDLKGKYAAGVKIVSSAAVQQDLEILDGLEKKVRSERKKVNDYLYYNACNSRRNDYFTINAVAHRFVSEVLKEELEYGLKYPRYYSTEKIIPLLASAAQVKGEIPFTFSKVVLKLGCPSPFLVPTAANNCILNVKYEILSKRYPPSEIGDDKVHPSKKHISRDDIAHKLAANYDADVVISLSSLKTLMDNIFPKLEHDWEIPVIVSEDPGGIGGGPRKCVFLEKSIPSSSLSVRAKNELFYSYALKCKFTHTYPQKSRKFKGSYAAAIIPDDVKPVSKEEQAELSRRMSDLASFDDICEVSEKVCELDTFGISSSKIPPIKPKVLPSNDWNPVNNGSQSYGKTTVSFNSSIDNGDDEEGCDDEEGDVEELLKDKPFIRNLKGMIVKICTEKTDSATEKPADEDVDKSAGNCSDLTLCLSPMSNADSEHDRLVIDCDTDEKKSDFSLLAVPERKEAVFEEVAGVGKVMSFKNTGLKSEKGNLHSENEDDDIGRKKHKVIPLPSEDNSSDNSTIPSLKNESRKTDTTSPKTKKSPSSLQFKSPLDEILVSQHKMLKPKDNIDDDASNIELPKLNSTDPMDEIAKDYPPLCQPENVTYSLWHLGQLKILLRSEVDSQVATSKCPNTPAFLFPKLEYQLMYGFEVTTPSELMKQWVHLYTHPGSHVVKVRINATRSNLAMLEEVNLPNLPQDKNYFDPKRGIQQLHSILDTLKSLPEGQYLLVHRKGEQTLTLQKAVNTAKHGAFDLHSSIKQRLEEIANSKDADTTRKEVPWLPIDSSIALPEHNRDSRIPGCFYPTDFKRKRRNQNQQDKKTGQQKQNKNKNKGQAKKT